MTFALLMMFAAVAPVFASQPKTTFQWAEIDISVNPGTQWITDTSILHQRGSQASNWMFGYPWGDTPINAPGIVTGNANINLATLSGNGVSKFSDSFLGGTMEGNTVWKATGAGPITYDGIDITSGPLPFPITSGTQLGGLLFEGTYESHGTGELEGIKVKGEYVGVVMTILLPDNTPFSFNVVWGTATSMATGASK